MSRITNKPPADLNDEIAILEGEADDDSEEGKKWGIIQLLKSPDLRLPLLLVCAMQMGQQTSGINAVSVPF